MKRSRQIENILNFDVDLHDFGPCHLYLRDVLKFRDSNIAAVIRSRFISVYKSAFKTLHLLNQISSHSKKWENLNLFNILFSSQNPRVIKLQFHSTQSYISKDDDEFMQLIQLWMNHCNNNPDGILIQYLNSLEDQHSLRRQLEQSDGIAFVCNGSFLPSTSTSRYFNINHNTSFKSPILSTSQNNCNANFHHKHNNSNQYIPFLSPTSMQIDFILPHHGKISGMLIPQGIVIIVGGGYHGKSTLLNALKMGVYDKHPRDGCEFVISRKNAFSIRSEEGRYVGGIDISPFITTLPIHAKVDPTLFQSNHASGSTSMATNVIEVLEIIEASRIKEFNTVGNTDSDGNESGVLESVNEMTTTTSTTANATNNITTSSTATTTTTATTTVTAMISTKSKFESESDIRGLPSVIKQDRSSLSSSSLSLQPSPSPSVLLLDEDICANNFMVCDSRMRALVSHEPIIPFSYRVNGLYKQFNISSIIVVGGSGDWFDVQTCTILMDNYQVMDMTKRANSISHSFCNGRVQYNGRGLVHQLHWPEVIIEQTVSTKPRSRLSSSSLSSSTSSCGTTVPLIPSHHHHSPSLTRSRYVDMRSARSLFGIFVTTTAIINQDTSSYNSSSNKINSNSNSNYCYGNNSNSNANSGDSNNNTNANKNSSKHDSKSWISIAKNDDCSSSFFHMNMNMKSDDDDDDGICISLQCDVCSITCTSSDYSRIRYRVKDTKNSSCHNRNNGNSSFDDDDDDDDDDNNCNSNNNNSSSSSSLLLLHREVEIDLSHCDQFMYSYQSSTGLAYTLLYSFVYITIINQYKKNHKKEMKEKVKNNSLLRDNSGGGDDNASKKMNGNNNNNSNDDDTDDFISINDLIQVYDQLKSSASAIDEFIIHQLSCSSSYSSSLESASKLLFIDSNYDNSLKQRRDLELYVGYYVYQIMISNDKFVKNDNSNNNDSNRNSTSSNNNNTNYTKNKEFSISNMCNQNNSIHFVLALNRIRGLKFAYLNS